MLKTVSVADLFKSGCDLNRPENCIALTSDNVYNKVKAISVAKKAKTDRQQRERDEKAAKMEAAAMEVLNSGKEPSNMSKADLETVLRFKRIKPGRTKAESLDLYQAHMPPQTPATAPTNSP